MNTKTRKRLLKNNIALALIMLAFAGLGIHGMTSIRPNSEGSNVDLDSTMRKNIGLEYKERDHVALMSVINSSDAARSSATSGLVTLSSLMLQVGGLACIVALYNAFLVYKLKDQE